jgi:hypothetical protein
MPRWQQLRQRRLPLSERHATLRRHCLLQRPGRAVLQWRLRLGDIGSERWRLWQHCRVLSRVDLYDAGSDLLRQREKLQRRVLRQRRCRLHAKRPHLLPARERLLQELLSQWDALYQRGHLLRERKQLQRRLLSPRQRHLHLRRRKMLPARAGMRQVLLRA